MSELVARQAIQTTARASSAFANDDVTLNDWSILDQPGAMDAAPFLIIMGSEDFMARTPGMSGKENEWSILTLLIEAWDDDWPTTEEAFLASRQALIDAFQDNGGAGMSPGGSGYYNVREIRAAAPYGEYTPGTLTWMAQPIVFVTEEME